MLLWHFSSCRKGKFEKDRSQNLSPIRCIATRCIIPNLLSILCRTMFSRGRQSIRMTVRIVTTKAKQSLTEMIVSPGCPLVVCFFISRAW